MADMQSFLFASELVDDFVLTITNDILEDNDDDMVVSAAVSCFMRRKLTCIHDYFEVTLPRYLPDEFKNHFRMTRETYELLCQAVIQTGHIPVGNPHGRPVIAPEKQVLAFLWRIANQEPARAVADRFDMTISSVNRVFHRVVKAVVSLSSQYIRWSNGES